MSKRDNFRNRIVSALCIGVVLMAMVPLAGCPSTPEAPPAYLFQWGSAGNGNGQFNLPYGVATDNAGNVFVVDSYNDRVQKFTSAGVYVTQWGSYGAGNGQFNSGPAGLAVDAAGNVYVVDQGNYRIQKFSSTGVYQLQWGSPVLGSGNGQFNYPTGVATDAAGNVYVADSGNNRIQKFTGSGGYITQWGGTGSGNGQLDSPSGVAVDTAGNVYVADTNNNRIQKFSSTGVFLTQWGTLGSGNGQFHNSWCLAVDATTGNVYVSDANNNRIEVFGKLTGPGHPTLPTSVVATLITGLPAALEPGTIIVNAYLDGTIWTVPGIVNFTLTGPQPYSGTTPQTYTSAPVGTYTLNYNSGTPPNATFVNISPIGSQQLTAGGTITFNLNFRTKPVPTGTIIVNAKQNGVAWTGSVVFTLTQQTGGSQTYSGTSVQTSYNNAPVGTYLLSYVSGGPTGSAPTSITNAASQPVTANSTTTFTLNWDKTGGDTGTITVLATYNGAPWPTGTGTGAVTFNVSGASSFSGSSVPSTFPNKPAGTYNLVYTGGGPTGSPPSSITPSPLPNLTGGGGLIITLNFTDKKAETGTIIVNATFMGPAGKVSWTGPVIFTLIGPQTIYGTSVPLTSLNMTVGAYTLTYVSGGPSGANSIAPSITQTLTAGGTITFTITFQ